jgi:hypothetical protein
MNSFVEAVKEVLVETRTDNGMKTYESSKNNLVDLFFRIGSSRGKDLSADFHRALAEDSVLALRLLMWARDVRGGAGEREVVRTILTDLERKNPSALDQVLNFIPEYGRWDDLLIFETQEFKTKSYELIAAALKEGNGLCAKWMPRKGTIAVELREFLKLSPKSYRTLLVSLTKVVEQKMCAKEWSTINYNHVPSLASARYQKAFARNDPVGYTKYKDSLVKGEAKVNASAVYPYDVIKSFKAGGDPTVVEAQWNSLPNYIGDQLILPMVDVSGSMETAINGNPNLTAMDVSVSLGLYLADKNSGPFKDMFLTFSMDTKIEVLKGNIIKKLAQLKRAEWGMNTDLHRAFHRVLDYAKKGKVSAKDMPKYILILSDMEFDHCTKYDDSAIEMIERKYSEAGYELPKIVFWNINARSGNVPVKHNKNGVALISGFSPSIMTSVLKAESFTPYDVMVQTLNSDRYTAIV